MFVILFVVLLVAWLLDWGAFHVASGLIHLLLLAAAIYLIVHFVRASRPPLSSVRAGGVAGYEWVSRDTSHRNGGEVPIQS